ncbi:MAG: S41 family peptidase [Chloroherpetonaceae bacterium]|nr:S41 family peptidase [Chloroherpetonaceae bacterium]
MKGFGFVLLIIAVLIFGLIVGTRLPDFIGSGLSAKNTQKFNEAFRLVSEHYVDNVDNNAISEGAIEGMLQRLDPHSVYLSPEEARRSREEFQGSFEGIGIQFEMIKDTLVVIAASSEGPSEKVGIQSGDRIISINDTNAVGLKNDEIIRRLRGPKGSIVKVTIKRSGYDEALIYNIKRDKIATYSVDTYFMLDSQTGYIKISQFIETTHSEFLQASTALKERGMTQLILDLRNNPGGILQQAIKISDEFLGASQKIVSQRGRSIPAQTDYSEAGQAFESIPLIVLVNRGSASASEIVAGAIQDHDRGLIVGETTFGKGLVQRPYELTDGAILRVTIAKYYTPSGRLIQRPFYEGESRRDYYEEADRYAKIDEQAIAIARNQNLELIESAPLIVPDSAHKAYRTDAGRLVLEGGGITPDYFVWSDSITRFYQAVRSKRLFSEFALSYLEKYPELRKKFMAKLPSKIEEFSNEFVIESQDIQSFLSLTTDNGIAFDSTEFVKDERYLLGAIKSEIAGQIWGSKARAELLIRNDNVLRSAMTLFPKATAFAQNSRTK